MRALRWLVVLGAVSGCIDFKKDLAGCVDAGACEGAVDGGPVLIAGSLCFDDGWCWQTKVPHVALAAVVMLGPNDFWALGDHRTTLRSNDGITWVPSLQGPEQNLYDARVIGSTLFAVGAGGLWKWDGTRFSQVTSSPGPLLRVNGLSETNLWVQPYDTTRDPLHWDGTSLVAQPRPAGVELTNVMITPAGVTWATGKQGYVGWLDGGIWVQEDAGTTMNLATAVVQGDTLWVGGDQGALRRRAPDGTWSSHDTTHRGTWTNGALAADGSLWLVGEASALAHADSAGAVTESDQGLLINLYGITQTPGGMLVAGSGGYVARLQGSSWVRVDSMDTVDNFTGLAGLRADDLWAVAAHGGVFHFDGTTWSQQENLGFGLSDVSVVSEGAVWAQIFNGPLFRRRGGAWSQVTDTPLTNKGVVSAVSDDAAWVAGEVSGSSYAAVYSGGALHPMSPLSGKGLQAIAGVSPTEAWACNTDGELLHLIVGQTTTPIPGPKPGCLALAVAGTQVFAAFQTQVYRYDGSWHLVGATDNDLISRLAVSGSTLWVSGDYGALWAASLDGSGWSSHHALVHNNLNGLWVSPAGDVFVAGGEGALLVRPHAP